MAKNDNSDATAARTASSHFNLHCYLLNKGHVPTVGQEKDVFLNFQIKYIFL